MSLEVFVIPLADGTTWLDAVPDTRVITACDDGMYVVESVIVCSTGGISAFTLLYTDNVDGTLVLLDPLVIPAELGSITGIIALTLLYTESVDGTLVSLDDDVIPSAELSICAVVEICEATYCFTAYSDGTFVLSLFTIVVVI